MAKTFVEVEKSGWGSTARRLSIAFKAALVALGPLGWEDRRRVIRCVCAVFGIDPRAL